MFQTASMTMVKYVLSPFRQSCVLYARSKNCENRLLASLCKSVRLEQLGSHWTDFHEIWYFSFFRKYVENIQVWLQSDKSNGYFTWRTVYIYDKFRWILLGMGSVSDKSCREKQNTHFECSNSPPSKIVPCMRMWKVWWSETGHRWEHNTTHAFYMLDN
jgi:hypothetical protein